MLTFILSVHNCGYRLTASKTIGHFTTPYYPKPHPPNLDCFWTIVAQNPNERVAVTIVSGTTDSCCDYIEVIIVRSHHKTVCDNFVQVSPLRSCRFWMDNKIRHTDRQIAKTLLYIIYSIYHIKPCQEERTRKFLNQFKISVNSTR